MLGEAITPSTYVHRVASGTRCTAGSGTGGERSQGGEVGGQIGWSSGSFQETPESGPD